MTPHTKGTPPRLQPTFGERSIDDFRMLFTSGKLNLEPGFQRKSVWTTSDRRRLIQSILSSYPLPSVFLYQRHENGKTVLDVLDGKQRLETILMFSRQGRFKRGAFEVRLDLGDGAEWVDWKRLSRNAELFHAFEVYKIPTVEVTGDLASMIDLFVRINSTGKPLTSGEKRHAKFYKTPFLKAANALVGRFARYLVGQRILTDGQLERMKGTELFSELLLSIAQGGIINKKTALDRAIGNEPFNGNTLQRVTRELTTTLNTLKRLFPDLVSTRFRNSAEFYSLVMLVWEMRHNGFVLSDKRRNRAAERVLRKLSTGVDELRETLRKARSPKGERRPYSDYLLTVQGDTDSAANRTRRREILANLLFSIFNFKDDQRLFTPEQRRIIWNTDEKRTCAVCGKEVRWGDVSIDHILAHTRGGKTTLRNAQLTHKRCNSKKGAR